MPEGGGEKQKGFIGGLFSKLAGGPQREEGAEPRGTLIGELMRLPVDWSLEPVSMGREMMDFLDEKLGLPELSLVLVRDRLDQLLAESGKVPEKVFREEKGHDGNCPVVKGAPLYSPRATPESLCIECRPKCELGKPVLRIPLKAGGETAGALTLSFGEPPRALENPAFLEALSARLSLEFNIHLLSESNHLLEITDNLTRVYNYRYFTKFLEMELERSRRYDHPFSVLLFDIKQFREFNLRHGYSAGDAILIEIARLMKSMVRSTDFVGRYSGQQFVVVLIETDREGAEIARKKINSQIAAYTLKLPGAAQDMKVSLRSGIAVFPRDATISSRLIVCAEDSLRKAKKTP